MRILAASLILFPVLCVYLSAAPVEFIQLNLQEREARAQEIEDEIKKLDAKIEAKIERIEAQLRSSKDSTESGITVQQTKENLIEGLSKLAAYYKEQRELLLTETKRNWPRADPERLSAIAQAYDARIDKRINQILALNHSLGASTPNGTGSNDKQLIRRASAEQAATQDAILKTISKLEEENRVLKARLSSLSEKEASATQGTIAENDKRIERRKLQLTELNKGGQSSAKPVTKSEALQLRKLLEATAEDIKEDSYRLSNLVIEYLKEEEAVRQLKIELERDQTSPTKEE